MGRAAFLEPWIAVSPPRGRAPSMKSASSAISLDSLFRGERGRTDGKTWEGVTANVMGAAPFRQSVNLT